MCVYVRMCVYVHMHVWVCFALKLQLHGSNFGANFFEKLLAKFKTQI